MKLPILVVSCLLTSCGPAAISLKDMGSFHIGGREAVIQGKPLPKLEFTPGVAANVDPNGTYAVEQMYVQYFIPTNARRLPLLLWHGAWLTAATYETTPDGREGWLNYFLKHGWPVYASDAVERGRAGWAPYPDIYTSEPLFLTKENAFARFRLAHSQFPLEASDQFLKQAVPRWTSNNAATIAAYVELVDKVCPCVVLVHSQSGLFGASVAEMRPDKVKALIMVEPANGGDLKKAANLKNTPVLAIFGDGIDQDPRWSQIREVDQRYFEAVRAAGGSVDVIDLPRAGIRGNSHMIMMDKNSDEVAGLIEKWLEDKVK